MRQINVQKYLLFISLYNCLTHLYETLWTFQNHLEILKIT